MMLYFDVEVDIKSNRIIDYGCVDERGRSFHDSGRKKFEKFVKKANFYCGHNVIKHDLKFINRTNVIIPPSKCVDTLYWSALLYPQRPYHTLVKNDKLLPEDSNNPLNDSKSAMDLFSNEIDAFSKLDSNLQKIFYYLLKETDGFSAFFSYINYQAQVNDIMRLIYEVYES